MTFCRRARPLRRPRNSTSRPADRGGFFSGPRRVSRPTPRQQARSMRLFSCRPSNVARWLTASGIFRIAVEQLNRDALRSAQKADLYAGPRRMRLLGKLDTLLPEIGRDCIDARNRKTEMVEALIRRDRCRIDTVTGIDLGQEDHGAAEPDVHARLALLRPAGHLGAEHAFEPLRGGLRIGRAQMNLIPLIVWHRSFSVIAMRA